VSRSAAKPPLRGPLRGSSEGVLPEGTLRVGSDLREKTWTWCIWFSELLSPFGMDCERVNEIFDAGFLADLFLPFLSV